MRSARRLPVNRAWASVIQCLAFVRKELVEISRQPRLVVLLVLGPFLVLLLFGIGYGSQQLELRTLFVGPPASFYEDAVREYEEVLEGFVDSEGFTTDEEAARRALDDGEIDIVVIFPPDPLDTVLAGERAEIEVLHDKLDPIQEIGVVVSAELAVQRVNSAVLSAVVASAQTALAPVDDLVATLLASAEDLVTAAASEPSTVPAVAETIADTADRLYVLLSGSSVVLERLGADPEDQRDQVLTQLDTVRQEARALSTADPAEVQDRAQTLAATINEVAAAVPAIAALDPEVLVRPFAAATENIVAPDLETVDFFTPAAVALLLQHLALTFAALSLVRDRSLGLFELLRAGPLSSFEILLGKTIAYMVVGLALGGILMAAAVFGLGVPYEGAVLPGVVALGLVLLASLGLGLLISLFARTETQAVQFAMLTLLCGLFFSGFMLPLEDLGYPVRALAWLLPVTYGIRALHDIMFRGTDPAAIDLAGLAALVVVYGGLATIILRRRLRRA